MKSCCLLITTIIYLCAVLAPPNSLLRAADAPAWDVRYALAPDQKEEWTAQGRIPGWQVKIGPGPSSVIEIVGDEKGDFRGVVLVGRRWSVPSAPPVALRFRLSYQTYCAMNDPKSPRAGQLRIALFTPARWEEFAKDPRRAGKLELDANAEDSLPLLPVYTGQDDVTEWRAWEGQAPGQRLKALAGRQVVVAIMWSAYHFCEEWARVKDFDMKTVSDAEMEREFFGTLDLGRPDLSAVKAALEKADIAGARSAFVAHMRTRQEPIGPQLSPDGSPRGLQAADEILQHQFRFVGCPPTKLGMQILWNEDPHNYDQWAIALNRHSHWVTLGRAYAATKNEAYAREFVAQLNSWVSAMPAHIGRHWVQGPFFEVGRSPLTLDAGIRMGQTWWPAYYYFKDSPAFDAESQVRMFRSFRDHALYLMEPRAFNPASNWGAMEVAGLLHIAVMLPEFKASPDWLRVSFERLSQAQKQQVYPDGAQIELTPGYHGVTLGNFLSALEVTRRNQIALPPSFSAELEKMFEYYVAIAMPDGRTPALNDSGWSSVRSFLTQGAEMFPQRRDFEYLATSGKKGAPHARTSWSLPYAGWYVMRSGWGPDDLCLHFDAGPFGAGHQHEDKLSIIVHAGRKTILTEGGTYSYDDSDWRRYVLSTRAHNTLRVDGLDQNRRTRRDAWVEWKPQTNRWITNDQYDYAEGAYDSGYGPRNAVSVTHTRQVLFVKPDYWIVVDTMTPKDKSEHEYEALFHLDADTAAVDSRTLSVSAEYEGNGFRIMPLRADGLHVEIVKGRKEPDVQGWLPTGRHNELRPIPTAVYRWKAAGPSAMAYALVPRPRDKGWPIVGARPLPPDTHGQISAEVLLSSGEKDILLRREPKAGRVKVGPVETESEFVLLRLNASGAAIRTFRVDGGS